MRRKLKTTFEEQYFERNNLLKYVPCLLLRAEMKQTPFVKKILWTYISSCHEETSKCLFLQGLLVFYCNGWDVIVTVPPGGYEQKDKDLQWFPSISVYCKVSNFIVRFTGLHCGEHSESYVICAPVAHCCSYNCCTRGALL